MITLCTVKYLGLDIIFQIIPFSAKKPTYIISPFLHISVSRSQQLPWWAVMEFAVSYSWKSADCSKAHIEKDEFYCADWDSRDKVCTYKIQCSTVLTETRYVLTRYNAPHTCLQNTVPPTLFRTALKSEDVNQNMDISPQSYCLQIILKEQKELRRNRFVLGKFS